MICMDCKQPAHGEVQGIPKCTDHYIEALEHSAHLTSFVTGTDYKVGIVPPSPETLKKHLDNSPNL